MIDGQFIREIKANQDLLTRMDILSGILEWRIANGPTTQISFEALEQILCVGEKKEQVMA